MPEESSSADQLLKFLETLSTHIQKRLLPRHLVVPLAKVYCQQFLESLQHRLIEKLDVSLHLVVH
jgi:hypothetical protein